MKKLFVLFLLVALVPFSIGCFGSDSDDTPIDVAKLSASATLPKAAGDGLNLRGAAVPASHFKNVKMKIGDVVLDAVTEDTTDGGLNYTVVFEKIVTTAQKTAATTGVVPVVITKADKTEIKFAIDYSSVSATTGLSVTVATDNSVSVPAGIVSYPGFVKVTSITESKNTLTPSFTVVFDGDIQSIDSPNAFDIKVTSGTTSVAAALADFNSSYDVTSKTMTVSLKNKTLTDGKTYTVTINKLISKEKIVVVPTTYTFTVTLTK